MNMRNTVCPIYFEDHHFGGHVGSIESFTNIGFGIVRITFLNGKPYFAATDICKGLCLNTNRTTEFVSEAVTDILNGYFNNTMLKLRKSMLDIDTPSAETRGCYFMDPEELYFYITIDVSHKIGNSDKIVIQKVNTIFISEPVLYMLTFKSRKKEAIEFKAWLAMDVLPNLRALGGPSITDKMIGNEYSSILDALKKIDNIYENLKDYNAKKALQDCAMYEIMYGQASELECIRQIQNALNALQYKMNNLGGVEDYILNSTSQIDNKVTNIATGLNMVFGKSMRN